MGDYSAICELRGRAKPGTGCTLAGRNPAFCAKKHPRGRCMTYDVDALVDPASMIVNGASLGVFKAAIAATKAGTADTFVSYVADSTGIGAGAGTVGGPSAATYGARALSPVALLASMSLSMLGVPGANDSFWGAAALDTVTSPIASNILYDPRIAAVVSGANEWGFQGIAAGQLTGITERFWANNLGTGALSFTPTEITDTAEYFYIQSFGKGQFTVDIGAAVLGTVDSGPAGNSFKKTAGIAGTRGQNIWNVQRNGTGASITIVGARFSDSTARKIHWMNLSQYGARSVDFANAVSPWSYAPAIGTIAAHLTIIRIGLNDIAGSVSAASWEANTQIVITNAKAGNGDVLLSFLPPQDPVTRDPASLTPAYLQAAKRLAVANNIPLIDLTVAMPTYAQMLADGYMFDGVHEKYYTRLANAEMSAIKALVA